jgi:hypothetical protein
VGQRRSTSAAAGVLASRLPNLRSASRARVAVAAAADDDDDDDGLLIRKAARAQP